MLIHQRGPNEVCESPPLPPGFRFHPTDEELVSCYLTPKVLDSNVIFQAIGAVDFNKCEPWDLPAKANVGHQNDFYFFSRRDRKYSTGLRTNRTTEAGYWKATGKDREVKAKSSGRMLGMKKTLVFYKGRAPKDEKTNWIMHEYRLESQFKPDQQEWVVCRAFEKSVSSRKTRPESCNAGCNGKYSTDLPFQIQNAPSGPQGTPQGWFQDATFLGQEKILRRSDSYMKGKRELGDLLENLLSAWDMDSPVPIWDLIN